MKVKLFSLFLLVGLYSCATTESLVVNTASESNKVQVTKQNGTERQFQSHLGENNEVLYYSVGYTSNESLSDAVEGAAKDEQFLISKSVCEEGATLKTQSYEEDEYKHFDTGASIYVVNKEFKCE